MINVVVIGSGNVAYSLSKALSSSSEVELLAIYSRNEISGGKIAELCCSNFVKDINQLPKADIYLVAVSDGAVEAVSKELESVVEDNAIIAHTSGATNILEGDKFGRFYPLQTFTSGILVDFKKITIFIEANNKKKELNLITLSCEIALGYQLIDSNRLKTVHLAATFANNFTNRILHYAEKILARENIGREVLYPLIEESIEKIKRSDMPIAKLQSGAAARGDEKTIKIHQELIADNKEILNIYNTITKNICNDKF